MTDWIWLRIWVGVFVSSVWAFFGGRCYSQSAGNLDRAGVVSHAFFVRQDCNTSNCHGRESLTEKFTEKFTENGTEEIWRSSGEVWLKRDPHASAYVGLFSAESLRIVQRLWPQDRDLPDSTQSLDFAEFLEARCVACHASELAPKTQRVFGVDCQSCHGAASEWGEGHYSSQWRGLGAKRFEDPSAHGRVNTSDVWTLAQVCAACHIGELKRDSKYRFDDGKEIDFGDREVTHTLMAAGHPPTYFEYSHAIQRYPRHWDTVGVSADLVGDEEIELWRIGQLVTARQRVRLLKDRMERGAIWELTEYRCTSCHQEIGQVGVDRDPHEFRNTGVGERGDVFGRVPWDGWYMEQVEIALLLSETRSKVSEIDGLKSESRSERFTDAIVSEWNEALRKLRGAMEVPNAMRSAESRQSIIASCDVMLGILDPLIDSRVGLRLPTDWTEIDRRLFESVRLRSWESGVQWQRVVGVVGRRRGVAEAFEEAGVYQPSWGLPGGTWRRGDRMAYSGSREYPRDIREWVEQIAKTMQVAETKNRKP